MNAVILNMFRWDRRSQPSPSEQVTSAVDWGTRSVIVTASPKNHEIIKAFVEKVDVESNVVKELHTYKLKEANAEEVARALQNVYRGRRATGRGDQPVQITPEAATNSLLILANAEEMVRWIDQPSLVPFLVCIAEKDRGGFRDAVVEKMLERTRQKDGTCFETFRRINVSAQKI